MNDKETESISFKNINQPVQTNNEKFVIISTNHVHSDQTVNYSDSFFLRGRTGGYLENKKIGNNNYKLVLNTENNPKEKALELAYVWNQI